MKSQNDSYLISYSTLSDVSGVLIIHFQGIYIKLTNISLSETKYKINNISLHFFNNLADSN